MERFVCLMMIWCRLFSGYVRLPSSSYFSLCIVPVLVVAEVFSGSCVGVRDSFKSGFHGDMIDVFLTFLLFLQIDSFFLSDFQLFMKTTFLCWVQSVGEILGDGWKTSVFFVPFSFVPVWGVCLFLNVVKFAHVVDFAFLSFSKVFF